MDALQKITQPAIWVGVVAFVVGVLAHFGPGIIAGVTGGGYLNVAQALFLFVIAVSLAKKG